MQDSIFTKMINGEIPCVKVFEDDKTFAFVDRQPIQFGQVVVVPKTQVPTVWDLNSDDYAALMATVQKVGQYVRAAFPDKLYVGVNVEGLGVRNHAHVKVFPFDNGPEYHHDPINDPDLSVETMQDIAKRLKLDD